MKKLFCTINGNTRKTKSGGGVHFVQLIEWIKENKKDVEVSLIHPQNDFLLDTYEQLRSVRNIGYFEPNFLKKSVSLAYLYRSIVSPTKIPLKEIQKNDQATLLATSHYLTDTLPIFIKSIFSSSKVTKSVYVYHLVLDSPRKASISTFLSNIQERISLFLIKKSFDRIIVINDFVMKKLLKFGFDRKKIKKINSLAKLRNVKVVDYKRKKYDLCYLGRFAQNKGVYDFIEVFKKIQKNNPKITGIMIGDGTEFQNINEITKREKLDIKLPGFVDDDNKFRYLSESKFFVFPSIEEGWGIAIIESLSSGTPVIAYDLDIYKEIFGNNIFTTELKNVKALTQKTDNLLKKYSENFNEYEKKQKEIMKFSRDFDLNKTADEEFSFLTNLDNSSEKK
ncbi:glycosyltransferase family 4 protein [Candidatus Dojkabacteria bacterium]|nr:glycosyltransferase family 4 protein [Candidatus Dojkabacteria bacterium]